MPFRKQKSIWSDTKPPVGVPIDRGSPFAAALDASWNLHQPGKVFINDAPFAPPASNLTVGATTVSYGVLRSGIGLSLSTGGYLSAANPLFQGTSSGVDAKKGPFSILIRFRAPGSVPTSGGIASIGDTAAAGAPLFLVDFAAGPIVRALVGDVAFVTIIGSPVAGKWYDIVSTISAPAGVAGTEVHYVNGVQVYSGARTMLSGTNTTNANFFIASDATGTSAIDVEFCRVFSRALLPNEVLALYERPYRIYGGGRRRIISGTGGAAGAPKLIAENFNFHPLCPMGI